MNNMEKLKDDQGGKSKIAGLKSKGASGANVKTFPAGTQLKEHEFSKRLPERTPEQQASLDLDIGTSGVNEPLTMFEGDILCGRHRYKSCIKFGLAIPYVIFEGTREDASLLARSSNSNSLVQYTKSQLAMSAAMDEDVQGLFQIAAKKKKANLVSNSSEMEFFPIQGTAIEFASKLYGVNERYIRKARSIFDKNKVLSKLVFDGEMTLSQADAEINPKPFALVDPTPQKRLTEAIKDWRKSIPDDYVDAAITHMQKFNEEITKK